MTGPTREHVRQFGDPQQDDPRVVMPFNGFSGSGDVTGDVPSTPTTAASRTSTSSPRSTSTCTARLSSAVTAPTFAASRCTWPSSAEPSACSSTPIPRTTATTKATPYPGPVAARHRRAARLGAISLQISRAILKPPASPQRSICPTPPASKTSQGLTAISRASSPFPSATTMRRRFCRRLKGPGVPQGWQGALPFRYHLGPGGVKVHLVSQQDYQRRIIWDVIGKIEGAQDPDAGSSSAIIATPGSMAQSIPPAAPPPCLKPCTASERLLASGLASQAHHRFLQLGRGGGRPHRLNRMGRAAGPGSRPRCRLLQCRCRRLRPRFLRFSGSLAQAVHPRCRPLGSQPGRRHGLSSSGAQPSPLENNEHRGSNAPPIEGEEVHVGDLGSGSDFTPFCNMPACLPPTSIPAAPTASITPPSTTLPGSRKTPIPHFLYLQEMARILGLEALRMADADVLPYDYVAYAREISAYIEAAKHKAADDRPRLSRLQHPAEAAASRFAAAAAGVCPQDPRPPAIWPG
jgi:N-acetylated-alpha-linked acidic dipeptidase